jgi:hypothetical protein
MEYNGMLPIYKLTLVYEASGGEKTTLGYASTGRGCARMPGKVAGFRELLVFGDTINWKGVSARLFHNATNLTDAWNTMIQSCPTMFFIGCYPAGGWLTEDSRRHSRFCASMSGQARRYSC